MTSISEWGSILDNSLFFTAKGKLVWKTILNLVKNNCHLEKKSLQQKKIKIGLEKNISWSRGKNKPGSIWKKKINKLD